MLIHVKILKYVIFVENIQDLSFHLSLVVGMEGSTTIVVVLDVEEQL
jgi:hypothetical protein